MSGYRIDELQGQTHDLRARDVLQPDDQTCPTCWVQASTSAARSKALSVQSTFVPQATKGNLWSASVFLAADTILGPAFFGVGVRERTHHDVSAARRSREAQIASVRFRVC